MKSFSYPLVHHDFTVAITAGVSAENDSLYIPHNDQVSQHFFIVIVGSDCAVFKKSTYSKQWNGHSLRTFSIHFNPVPEM